MNQQELFIKWKIKCDILSHLHSIIQNDFTRMIAEGYCTKTDIKNCIIEFTSQYQLLKEEIDDLYTKIIELLNKESK